MNDFIQKLLKIDFETAFENDFCTIVTKGIDPFFQVSFFKETETYELYSVLGEDTQRSRWKATETEMENILSKHVHFEQIYF